jgi:hypothetical protein
MRPVISRYIRLVRFSFLILISRFATLVYGSWLHHTHAPLMIMVSSAASARGG